MSLGLMCYSFFACSIVSEECYPYEGKAAAIGKCEVASVDLITVNNCPSGSSQRDLWEMTAPYRIANKVYFEA